MGEQRLYHAIADKITDLINKGVFSAGARLPGERELAERFGVSRVTIREAEIALQAIGRIEIKTGSGVYVSQQQPSPDTNFPNISAFELTEARSMVESEAAAMAAQNISDSDLKKLEGYIVAMGSTDIAKSTAADNDFHITIAEATGNNAMVYTIKNLWRMRSELDEVKAVHESVCHVNVTSLLAEHQAIYDALKAGNPIAARQAMRSHFRRLIESMLDATEKEALEKVERQAIESRKRFLATANI